MFLKLILLFVSNTFKIDIFCELYSKIDIIIFVSNISKIDITICEKYFQN